MEGRSTPVAPYVPLDGGPWRLSMGLRKLEESRWLEVDDQRAAVLAEKARLIAEEAPTVVAVAPAGMAPSRELLELVVSWLSQYHASLVSAVGRTLVEHTTGARIDTRRLHPIVAASMVVPEDLCVLVHADGAWRLVAACVCFPSRWSLAEKLGQSLDEIHGPVPGFHEELAAPSATFFDRLAPGRAAWRLNWTLLETPELHLPSPTLRRTGYGAPDIEQLWFRVERQTLRRLVKSGAIVFTIRTYVTSLAELLATRPEVAGLLASTLRTVSEPVAAYKGWSELLDPLVGALERRRAEPATPEAE